eukprot:2213836-Rhodomonas_salina.1
MKKKSRGKQSETRRGAEGNKVRHEEETSEPVEEADLAVDFERLAPHPLRNLLPKRVPQPPRLPDPPHLGPARSRSDAR